MHLAMLRVATMGGGLWSSWRVFLPWWEPIRPDRHCPGSIGDSSICTPRVDLRGFGGMNASHEERDQRSIAFVERTDGGGIEDSRRHLDLWLVQSAVGIHDQHVKGVPRASVS